MATLPTLLDKFAEFEPRGWSVVENHSRKLRKGNLMTTGSRGRGAPEMLPSDAVNLLLSMVCREANQVVDTVAALRSARLEGPWAGEKDPDDIIGGFSFAGRMNDAERFIAAGPFLDGLFEDWLSPHGSMVVDGVHWSPAILELDDPTCGFGRVVLVFQDHRGEGRFTLRFNVISHVITDIRDLPDVRFQNSLKIDGAILALIVNTVNGGNAS